MTTPPSSSGERPFACPHPGCGYTGRDARYLALHQRRHTPARCDLCPWEGNVLGLGPHRAKKHRTAAVAGVSVEAAVVARLDHAAAERRAARRTAEHRAAADRQAAPTGPRRPELRAALARLLPDASDLMLGRLARYVEKHQPAPGVWLVATAKRGPWLCRPSTVGHVVAREGDVAVVVAVTAVYRHLDTDRLAS